MGVLRGLPLLEEAGFSRDVFPAVVLVNECAGLFHGVVGETGRIRPHVRDEPHPPLLAELDALVQFLCEHHGSLRMEAEPARGLLLQRAGDERGPGVPPDRLFLDVGDLERLLADIVDVSLGGRPVADDRIVPRNLEELGKKRLVRPSPEFADDRPVFVGNEGGDRLLPLADQADGNGLDAPGRQAVEDGLPDERRDLVPHETVHDPARLLGVHKVLVHLGRVLHRLGDPAFRYLVEHHAEHVPVVRLDLPGDVPGDRFPFTVGIRRQIDGLRPERMGAQPGDDFVFSLDRLVFRTEPVLDVDPDLALREVLDMPDRRLDDEVLPEILVYRLGLGRRFHDNERFPCRVDLRHGPPRPPFDGSHLRFGLSPGNLRHRFSFPGHQ